MREGQSEPAASVALVALAALCWGVSGGLGAILMSAGWSALLVAFYRGAIGLLFALLWLLLEPRGAGLNIPRLWFWAVTAGIAVALNFSSYFISIDRGGVSVAATLMYSAPVFVHLACLLLRIETFSVRKSLAVALVIAGIVLLTEIYAIAPDSVTLLGFAAGLLAGVSYAVFIFAFKYAARYGSAQSVLAIAFATLILSLVWRISPGQIAAVPASDSWPLFIALGVLGAGLSFYLYVIGIRGTAPTFAAVVAMIEPVSASLFGIAILGERLGALQYLGMGLILLTATVFSMWSRD